MSNVDLLNKWFKILDEIAVNEDGSTSRLGYTATEDQMIAAVVKIGSEYGLKHYQEDAGHAFIYNGSGQGA